MRGYDRDDLRRRLLGVLSSGGATGSEIARSLGVSRLTMSRYLESFESEGIVCRRSAGSSTLWSPAAGAGLEFPAGYERAASEYKDAVLALSRERAIALVRASVGSGASVATLVTEAVLPAISLVQKEYEMGRAGRAEAALMRAIIADSLAAAGRSGSGAEPRVAVALSADEASVPAAHALAAALRSEGWDALALGDVSAHVDALYDVELERLLSRVMPARGGVVAVFAFASSAGGLELLARAVNSARRSSARGVLLALCGPGADGADADHRGADPERALSWARSL